MINNHKLFSFIITIIICLVILFILKITSNNWLPENKKVLGKFSEILSPLISTPEDNQLSTKVVHVTPIYISPIDPTAASKEIPSEKDAPSLQQVNRENSVSFVDVPQDIIEGNNAAFTWIVDGEAQIINSTSVYCGSTSNANQLSQSVSPEKAGYANAVKDFLNGKYNIPLRFVGNMPVSVPGSYYCRAYALIEGKNYWSEEKNMTVIPIPKNEIKIINYPSEKIKKGNNAAFTWDINGPSATTTFTVIVIGKESKPGTLATGVDIPQTPYTEFVKDFSGGVYNVPLRFVGSAPTAESGTFYFRALAFINGKNIWSDEYSFTVE
jgi:hypothetical protein